MPSGKGASRVWREAYAAAKKAGYTSFAKGTEGYRHVRRIAEMIAAKQGVK